MSTEVRPACSDCEVCGAAVPGRGAIGVDGDVVVRNARWGHRRHRRRSCDHCGHPIRFHALDVAPSAVAVVDARLPDDVPIDDPEGIGWSDRGDR